MCVISWSAGLLFRVQSYSFRANYRVFSAISFSPFLGIAHIEPYVYLCLRFKNIAIENENTKSSCKGNP